MRVSYHHASAPASAGPGAERSSDEALIATLKAQGAIADRQAMPIFAGLGVILIGAVLLALGIGLPLASPLLWLLGAAILLAGAAIMVVGAMRHKNNFREAQRAVEAEAQRFIQDMLGQVLEDVEYSREQAIPKETIREANIIPAEWNSASGSDYIRGSYQGLAIELSDVVLSEVTRTRDSEGRTHTHSTKVFEGMWILCDIGKRLSADVRLIEKRSRMRIAKKQLDISAGIETENMAFNEKFIILSDSPHEAFYLLTPHRMERILRADALGAGDTSLYFSKSGKIHIAINSGRNAFAIDWKSLELSGTQTLEDMRQGFESELHYMLDILDALQIT